MVEAAYAAATGHGEVIGDLAASDSGTLRGERLTSGMMLVLQVGTPGPDACLRKHTEEIAA